MRRPAKQVIAHFECVAESVPRANRMAGHVGKAAPLAAVHAIMVERVAGDVVTGDVLEASAVARFAHAVFQHAATKRIEYHEGFVLVVEASAPRQPPLTPLVPH